MPERNFYQSLIRRRLAGVRNDDRFYRKHIFCNTQNFTSRGRLFKIFYGAKISREAPLLWEQNIRHSTTFIYANQLPAVQ